MTMDYGNRIIATRTSRNGRRLSFQAFKNLDEMAAAILDAIDLDFDPEMFGSAATIDAEKNRAMREMHQGRYIGFGGQWIWERVTNDSELTFWENVRTEQNALRKVGAYLCTPVSSRHVGIDDYQAAAKHQPIPADKLDMLPPRARFIAQLMVELWNRIPTDSETHFNGYVTRAEASELQRLDLYQPGHSQYRFSVLNEDLSDFAQKDVLGRADHEREQDPTGGAQ